MRTVTDKQVRILMKEHGKHGKKSKDAMKADMDRKTAAKRSEQRAAETLTPEKHQPPGIVAPRSSVVLEAPPTQNPACRWKRDELRKTCRVER